ncbi:hypothetical protein AVEN_89017-1 [Araneus ventricosus]|uniref:Uncharacterized protein n=1 Tax=Araneus ventricosus TaxID=182803 RepID=A0A4Y2PT63_ARAVE|nr:hypothetical protein AVEN_89017-1 [Araneus ventricosus]
MVLRPIVQADDELQRNIVQADDELQRCYTATIPQNGIGLRILSKLMMSYSGATSYDSSKWYWLEYVADDEFSGATSYDSQNGIGLRILSKLMMSYSGATSYDSSTV